MTLGEALISVWSQALETGEGAIDLGGEGFKVKRTSAKKLRTVGFRLAGQSFEGIEQNPQTSSRWAVLAREGNRIMQFRCQGRYVANVCEGKLTRYSAWKSLGLPE